MDNTERTKLLSNMSMYDFAAAEMTLYLDTHPNDYKALEQFNKYRQMSNDAQMQYSAVFGPVSTQKGNMTDWDWIKGPWPWEVEAN